MKNLLNLSILCIAVLVSFVGSAQVLDFNEDTTVFSDLYGGGWACSIAKTDDDNDGVIDRITFTSYDGVSLYGNELENDGLGNFSNGDMIIAPKGAGDSVYADFDNDGDMDYLDSGTDFDGVLLQLIENTATGFITRTSPGLPALESCVILVGHFNNDDLLDVFMSGRNGSNFFAGWFINNGNFTFTLDQEFPNGLAQVSGVIGDVDRDGDEDIIYSGYSGSMNITYLLRRNASSGFTAEDVSSEIIPVASGSMSLGYLQGDEFPTYFASAGSDQTGVGAIAQLRKYDGSGVFGQTLDPPFQPMFKPIIEFTSAFGGLRLFAAGAPESAQATTAELYKLGVEGIFEFEESFDGVMGSGDVVFGDLNGDGYVDVLYSGARQLGVPIVRVYLNSAGLGIDENSLENLGVYPNPVIGRLTIESQVPIELVEVYNMLGQKVISVSGVVDSVNFEGLSPNMYLVHIKSEDGNTTVKKVIKQ
ncbi:MAG: hypothetical protein ACJA2Z_000448 [Candidatus Paceibacteria bacterium]|jgi:hypothetical protein